jgi:hypothetical protein
MDLPSALTDLAQTDLPLDDESGVTRIGIPERPLTCHLSKPEDTHAP